MLTIFNRQELLVTFDQGRLFRVQSALAEKKAAERAANRNQHKKKKK